MHLHNSKTLLMGDANARIHVREELEHDFAQFNGVFHCAEYRDRNRD